MANSIPKDGCNVLSPLHVLFHNMTLTLFPLKCGFYVSSPWFWAGFDYSRSNSKWILMIGDIKWYQWYKLPLLFFPWELSHHMWRSSNSLWQSRCWWEGTMVCGPQPWVGSQLTASHLNLPAVSEPSWKCILHLSASHPENASFTCQWVLLKTHPSPVSEPSWKRILWSQVSHLSCHSMVQRWTIPADPYLQHKCVSRINVSFSCKPLHFGLFSFTHFKQLPGSHHIQLLMLHH